MDKTKYQNVAEPSLSTDAHAIDLTKQHGWNRTKFSFAYLNVERENSSDFNLENHANANRCSGPLSRLCFDASKVVEIAAYS